MMPLGAQLTILAVWWVLRLFVFLGDTRATFNSTPPIVGLAVNRGTTTIGEAIGPLLNYSPETPPAYR